jgi:hypothetical protein
MSLGLDSTRCPASAAMDHKLKYFCKVDGVDHAIARHRLFVDRADQDKPISLHAIRGEYHCLDKRKLYSTDQ